MEQYVIFEVHQELFAITVQESVRVVHYENITRIPEMPQFLTGLYSFQDRLIPVLDLNQRFFQEATQLHAESKLLICEYQTRCVGLLVDTIHAVDTLEAWQDTIDMKQIQLQFIADYLNYKQQVAFKLDLSKLLTF